MDAKEVGMVRTELILDGQCFEAGGMIMEGDPRVVITAIIQSVTNELLSKLDNAYLPPSGIADRDMDAALQQMLGDEYGPYPEYGWTSLQDAYRLGRAHGRQENQGDEPE